MKSNFILILAFVATMLLNATAAKATVIDSVRFTYVSGTAGICKTYLHDTGTHTVISKVRTCHNIGMTGFVSYTADTSVVVHGNVVITRNVYCADPLVNYAQIIWDTLGGSPDTTNPPVVMMRMPSFGPMTVVRIDTQLFITLPFDPGNVPASITGTLGTDPTFGGSSPISSYTTSGMTGIIYDTVSFLTSLTPYWEKYVETTVMGTVTLTHADTTLPHSPTGADTGAIGITTTTILRHSKANTFGVTGTATDYVYVGGILHDSVVAALTATLLTQYPNFSHTGLAPLTTYVLKEKVTTLGGTVWLSNDTITTFPATVSGADSGAISIGITTASRHIKANTHGVVGSATEYWYQAGVLLDTTLASLTSVTTYQYVSFPHTALTSSTLYISKVKLHTISGDIWLADDSITTLPAVPTGSDSGAITIGITNATRHIKANSFGVAGTATEYWYQAGVLLDTSLVALTATSGWQYDSFPHTGLTSSTAYVSKVKLVTPGGITWLSNDTITTSSLPLVHISYDSASYKQVTAVTGTYKFYAHDTAAATIRYRVQTNSNVTFTGFSSFTAWDTVATVIGTNSVTVSVTNPDTLVSYGRVIWNTIGSSTTDTSVGVIMVRKPTILVAVTPDYHTFYSTLTISQTNAPITITGLIYSDTSYLSASPMHTYTLSGTGGTKHDTVAYVLPMYTTHPMVWTITSGGFTTIDTVVSTTLILVTTPYAADFGTPTIGSVTATRHIKCDIYGSTGAYARCYLYHLGVLVDSVNVPLLAIVGVQYIDFPFTGLSSLTPYTWTAVVHNSAGDMPLPSTGFTTDPLGSTLMANNAGSALTVHTNIHMVMLYSNRPGHVCDMTLCVLKVGMTVPDNHSWTGLALPTGTVNDDFTIYTPGTYKGYCWIHDDSLIAYSDTVTFTVLAPTNTLTTSADSAYIGDSVDVHYSALESDTSMLTSTAGLSTPVSSSGTIRIRIDTTTTLAYASTGITTVTKYKTVFAKARPIVDTTDTTVDHTAVNLLNELTNDVLIYPNPTNPKTNEVNVVAAYLPNTRLEIYDIAGRHYSTCTATSTETKISVASFPSGVYILHFVQYGNIFKEIKFIVQH